MLYYYWVTKGIRPSVLASLPYGEKLVIRAFYEKEIRELKVEQ
ncbi:MULTISPECIES: hypothetical protein [unclassified Dehalobacter]|nr:MULTISPECIES: hypothetical protein [unclassified Dehalobacter]